MQTPAFARGVVSAVDRLLHVAARFLQDLAHLAGHVGGELLFVANQDFAELEKKLSAFRRGRASPAVKRLARGRHCFVNIVLRGLRKTADQIARISGIAIFTPLAAAARHPLAVDVVVIGIRARARGRFIFARPLGLFFASALFA